MYLEKTCIEYASAARSAEWIALSQQLTSKKSKEYILHDRMVFAASEKYIDELYYNKMFNYAACWNSADVVDRALKTLIAIHLS